MNDEYDMLVNKQPAPEQKYTPKCFYCGEKHDTNVICSRMWLAHAVHLSITEKLGE